MNCLTLVRLENVAAAVVVGVVIIMIPIELMTRHKKNTPKSEFRGVDWSALQLPISPYTRAMTHKKAPSPDGVGGGLLIWIS